MIHRSDSLSAQYQYAHIARLKDSTSHIHPSDLLTRTLLPADLLHHSSLCTRLLACLLVVCNIRCCSLKLIWDLCCNMQWSYTQHWWDVGVSKIISYITEKWFSCFFLYSNQWLPCLFWSHVWGPTVSRAKCWHSKISGGPARGPPEPEKTWSLQAYEKSWGVLKLTYYDKSLLSI